MGFTPWGLHAFPILLLACTPSAVDDHSKVEDTDSDSDADTVDTSRPQPGDSGIPAFDCAQLPSPPLSSTELDAPRGYHDVVFDDVGNIIGWDGASLLAVNHADEVSVFVPGLAWVDGLDRLPNGDIVMADQTLGRLVVIDANGSQSTLATGLGAVMGVTVGPDGNVYVANGPDVSRIDASTGARTALLDAPDGMYTRMIAFNLDSTEMYVGMNGPGAVYSYALDATLNPSGSPKAYVSIPGAGFVDGLGVDACGNIYIADFCTLSLYRVRTDQSYTTLVTARPTIKYGHGLEWGSGVRGWRSTSLYLPQPNDGNTVLELDIGVPSGDLVRTWMGAP